MVEKKVTTTITTTTFYGDRCGTEIATTDEPRRITVVGPSGTTRPGIAVPIEEVPAPAVKSPAIGRPLWERRDEMAEKTITTTTFYCDRCATPLGSARPRQMVEARYQVDYGSVGNTIVWRDFCSGCEDAVTDFFAGRGVDGVLS